MKTGQPWGLFEVFGIELEYMVVDRETLQVLPKVDALFHSVAGEYLSDIARGDITWSNELSAHVVELKTTMPATTLVSLHDLFHRHIHQILGYLRPIGATLMPTAAHMEMNPLLESSLWKHDSHDIYALYDRVFGCKGHGWFNVQSVHLNLPFANDAQFRRLHSAIRVVLPVIPALCASSPVLEGQAGENLDMRLKAYIEHQKAVPELLGPTIPEVARSKADYVSRILEPIAQAFKPHDPAGIMDPYFLNSRGAIARFDRGAIEIRLADIQECPLADLSIMCFVVEVLKGLVAEDWSDIESQESLHEGYLFEILLRTIKDGELAVLPDGRLAALFGIKYPGSNHYVKDLLSDIFSMIRWRLDNVTQDVIDYILMSGTLARRMMNILNGDYSVENLRSLEARLIDCLHDNRLLMSNPV
jgi:carboxylate-amine ligase